MSTKKPINKQENLDSREEEVLDNIERAIELDQIIEEKIKEVEPKPPVQLNEDGTRYRSDNYFLGDDERKKFSEANRRIMNKLGLTKSRSVRI